ncbi:sulfotransferase 1 family member D1-like [Armigeres subalbatus]|uniref:sulfotransferase 1 family member D1-like n=1 Tax=Armigeres subalbatus TaxID=124917 RepID=UPI002ED12590
MSFEYLEIQDSDYLEHHVENEELDYILVKNRSIETVPIESWNPPAYCFTRRFQNYEGELKNFAVHPDDIWIASYPKSGTTWCQEMVWLICNNLNYDAAKTQPLKTRFPFLDVSLIHDLPDGRNSFQVVQNMPSPRFIKTHLPVSMLPTQYWSTLPKTVHICRNVKSVAVSYYHHSKNYFFRGTKEQFVRSFMKNLQFYSPIHSHVIGYHSLIGCNNILYLTYEDMKQDLRKEVERVCSFFKLNYNCDQLDSLCKHISFNSMKNNIACNYEDAADMDWKNKDPDSRFIRRGEVDSWKKELSSELCQELDEWNEKSIENERFRGLFT